MMPAEEAGRCPVCGSNNLMACYGLAFGGGMRLGAWGLGRWILAGGVPAPGKGLAREDA